LGGTSLDKGKRHPTIGDRVTIGADSRIGANAVVVRPTPENSVVVGVPGQIIRRSHLHHAGDAPGLNHAALPDVFAIAIKDLLARVDELEGRVADHSHPHALHTEQDDTWEGIEFMI